MSSDETDQPERRRGSFGRPVPGLEARVVDPETPRRRARRRAGRALVPGPAAHGGLLRARALRGVHRPTAGTATGDLFRVDDDGFFYFHGRRGDMIKTGARTCRRARSRPRCARSPAVSAPIVLGRPRRRARPGRGRGRPRRAGRRAPTSTRPRSDLRARLSAYKVPRRFLVLAPDELPMLSSGKPDLRRIVERFDEQLSASPCPRWSAGGPASSPDKPFVVTDDDALTYGELDRADRGASRARLRGRGRRQGHPRRGAHAERHGVGRSSRSAPARAGATARAAEHVPAPAGARGAAPRRGRRAPRARCPTFRGRDYLADLARDLPGPRRRDRGLVVDAVAAPARRSPCGTADRRVATDDDRRPGARRRARRGGPARRRPRDHLHVGQPRRARRA